MECMNGAEPGFVALRLWDQSALVLLDWLMETDEDAVPYTHPAQKQALRDLLLSLEMYRGLGYTDEELSVAQERVSSAMSDEDRRI